eukprot:2151170-Prymnesium_polylepis.1
MCAGAVPRGAVHGAARGAACGVAWGAVHLGGSLEGLAYRSASRNRLLRVVDWSSPTAVGGPGCCNFAFSTTRAP